MSDTIINNLDNLFRLSALPVVAVEGDKLVYCNPASEKAFTGTLAGQSAGQLFSRWPYTRGSVVSTNVLGRDCIITVSGLEKMLVLTLGEALSAERVASIPNGALASMASTITTLRMAADKLASLCGTGDKQELYISILYHNYYKLLRTTEHLTTLSGLKTGEYPFNPKSLELGTFLSDLVSSVRYLTQDSGVILEYEPPNELITVNADAGLLEQLVLGLIANSLDHTPSGGRITLQLTQSRGNAVLSVDDTGCGIPPEVLASVFQISVPRGPLELPSCKSGLGLPLASVIAAKHVGTVILESREGEGTSVRVSLRSSPKAYPTLRMPAPVYGSQIPVRALTELSEVLPRSQYTPDKIFGD